MATTVPTCQGSTAAGTTIQDIMTEYYDFVVANPGDWTIGGVIGGANPTSFWMTHATAGQINYRIVGGQILAIYDPDSTITDSASPGAPTNASPEKVAIPTPSAISGQMSMAQYGDATLCLVKGTANTFYRYGFHHGVIGQMFNASDAALNLDGKGMLNGIPNNSVTSTANHWWSSSSTESNRLSVVRDGTAVWFSPGYTGSPGSTSPANPGNTPVGGLTLAGDVGNSPNISGDVIKGIYKYVRIDAQGTLLPLQVRPSVGSNQGWLSWDDAATASRFRLLWDSTITP